MILSQSFWRRSIATVIAALAFVSLYEVTALDSKYAARHAILREAVTLPAPGVRVAYSATAYCKGMLTTSGVAVQTGIAAADPELLPVGSVVELSDLPSPHDGLYTVLDTGPNVQGRQIDIYMWSCNEALAFGRRPIHLTVLRFGWNPRATGPARAPLPSRPLPQSD